MKPFSKIENVREMRKKLGLTQTEFWNPIGVCQSSGSRYEIGRKIPDLYASYCGLFILRKYHWSRLPVRTLNRPANKLVFY